MISTFTISRLKVFLSAMFVAIVFSLFSQSQKNEFQSSNNPYGVSDNTWIDYINKTAILLEKVDEQSFLNYVVMTSDGNMADMTYFKHFLSPYWKKDYETLVYKVGTGLIVKEENVKMYLASLQPDYKKHFAEFQKVRDGIVASQNKSGSPDPNPDPLNCGSPCTNPGFESGQAFWDYWAADPSTNTDPGNLTAGFNPPPPGFFGQNPNPFLITNTGGFDPTVGGTTLPVVPPGGGNNALRIGDLNSWGSTSWGAARASISFTVSASNSNFTYRYAVVLNDPTSGHTDAERPYFGVKVRDASNNIITCGEYFVLAKAPFVGFFEISPGSDQWYRPWTTVFVPLQAYIGQCITVEFTSSDCTQGGHFGYGYVDCACEPLDIIASSPNICGGNSVTLSAPAGGASYAWTDSIGGTSGIVGSTTGQTITVNQGGTYQVIVTSVAGPTCITTLDITIGSSPSYPVSQFTNTTVCAGSSMQFTDTSTPLGSITAWAWDFDNDGITDDTLQNPAHIFAANGTFPVKLTISWGLCNADTTINVTVNAGVMPVLTPAGPFCPNDAPVTLTADIPGGVWSGTGITNSTTGTFTPSPSVIGNDTITYTVGGSCSASSSEVIIVNALPVADAGPDLNICSFGTGSIGASSTSGCTYTWSPTTGFTGSTTSSNPSLSLANPGPTATITSPYTVTILETSTGCQSSDTVNVIVSAVTNVNAGSTQYVCSGSSITLAGSIGGSATSGTWSGGTGTYSPNNTTLNAVYTPSASEYAADSVILTLTTNDPAGPCTFSSSNVTFHFYGIPVVNFSANDPLGCPVLCVDFTDLSAVGGADSVVNWDWNFGDGSDGSAIPNPSHCFSQSGLYDVKLIVTSYHGCISSLTQSQFVQVYSIPVAAFDATPNPASVIDPIITFNDQSSSDVNYWFWNFGDSTTLSPNTSSPVHEYPKDASNTYVVTLIVHNADGCYDTVSHEIFIGPEFTFFIPNVFTPNGDKTNDYFFGSGVGIIKYDLWIFDRWGDMIFHGKELNDKWDGKANKGDSESQIDVYVWKVTLTDVFNKEHNYIGIVSLVK